MLYLLKRKYMKWTILHEDEPYIIPSTGKKERKVIAQCECGKIKSVFYRYIKNGKSISCGCYSVQLLRERRIKHNNTINRKSTTEYHSWTNMKTRCYNPNFKQYKDYGGRGIIVCDRWLNSFQNFLDDMGKKPKGTSLDRINVDGNYEPNNCKWSTFSEQKLNQRK